MEKNKNIENFLEHVSTRKSDWLKQVKQNIMKTQLIKLQDKFILVSDERITDVRPHKGKWHLEKDSIINQFPTYLTDLSECKLIIAGIPELPPIDFSLLSEADCKRIGWVDVEKLAKNKFSVDKYQQDWAFRRMGFIEGFKTAQSLNDKMFSLEDILDAWELGAREGLPLTKKKKENIIQSLQQTSWEVEVEMCCNKYTQCNSNCRFDGTEQPKITNNSIKVTKIL